MTIKRIEEMEKLEKYLMDKNIPYEINIVRSYDSRWPIKLDKTPAYYKQICVPVFDSEKRKWDAVCHWGTYGFEDGLLEIMGDILTEEDLEYDTVKGFLTADEVIERIELKEKKPMPDEFESVKVSDIYKEILHLKKFYNEEIKKAMQKIEVISTTSGITLEEQEKIVADYNGRLSGLYAIQYYIDYKSGNLNPYNGE